MDKNTYCVIMAGGVGSRFWPLSRTKQPKQFIDILGTGRTLLQQTFDRLTLLCPPENIYIVTNAIYKQIVSQQLPDINPMHVLLEPSMRNTAPCIAYANHKIKLRNPNANIVVAPSDHLILKEKDFVDEVTKGLRFVSRNSTLLTLGIKPNRPETGYGYIQVNSTDKNKDYQNLYKVKTFTEKPNADLAKIFFESGEFYWNSGIFIWSLPSILESFEKHLSEVDSLFKDGESFYNTAKEEEFIADVYANCKNISIDYGIMEHADNVSVLCVDLGWSDLGTWGSLYEHFDKDKNKNAVLGKNVLMYDANGCIVNVPDDKLVVLQGLKDFIVVESENMLLVCKKKDEQQIRQIVNDVKLTKGTKFI